jgi:hypothetical protein
MNRGGKVDLAGQPMNHGKTNRNNPSRKLSLLVLGTPVGGTHCPTDVHRIGNHCYQGIFRGTAMPVMREYHTHTMPVQYRYSVSAVRSGINLNSRRHLFLELPWDLLTFSDIMFSCLPTSWFINFLHKIYILCFFLCNGKFLSHSMRMCLLQEKYHWPHSRYTKTSQALFK